MILEATMPHRRRVAKARSPVADPSPCRPLSELFHPVYKDLVGTTEPAAASHTHCGTSSTVVGPEDHHHTVHDCDIEGLQCWLKVACPRRDMTNSFLG